MPSRSPYMPHGRGGKQGLGTSQHRVQIAEE